VAWAEQLAGLLRQHLRQHMRTVEPAAPPVDLSVGVALLSETDSSDDPTGSLMAKADERLYSAKGAGKGRTATPHDPTAGAVPTPTEMHAADQRSAAS
jgi:GGDEF domain-containing protein